MSQKESTFYVTHAEAESATLRDVTDSQVVTLSENPGVEAGTVVEATVKAEPPMEVTYTAVELGEPRSIPVETVGLEPTRQAIEVASEQAVGELTTRERAGEGELHILTVPDEETDAAAADVVEDVATVERAARLGAERVEIRTAPGVVSVRYLPE